METHELVPAETLLKDIYEAAGELRWFEQKYSLLSETFYRVYQDGFLRDEDPAEIEEYLEWSGWCEIYEDRRQRYDRVVQQQLAQMTTPASLLDLHISRLRVTAAETAG